MSDSEPDLPEVCVCYIVRETGQGGYEVLLGEKKKGLGLGKTVGPGGKLEPGETPAQAVVREVLEESGLLLREEDLVPLGRIRYEFPFRPAWSQVSWVFATRAWQGEVVESDELLLRWHRVDDIPFADKHRARSNEFSPLLSLLTCFHFGYHHEHHDAPWVPWWKLPAHRALVTQHEQD